MFNALKTRNFRLFFIGQTVSLVGSWITNVATQWLVYRLTGSVALLGFITFASQFPSFLLAPFAGVIIDRHDRHRIVVIAQSASMLQSFALAVLTLGGWITVTQLILLGVAQGIIGGFEMPARQALLTELVPNKHDLRNAIALNAATFHGSRLVGPAIGGLLLTVVSEGTCFLIDGISFFAVLVGLLMMQRIKSVVRSDTKDIWHELKAGVKYTLSHSHIKTALLLVSGLAFFGTGYAALLPPLAADILKGGPELLGGLMAASGCGSLVGALLLAKRHQNAPDPNFLAKLVAIDAVALILLGLNKNIYIAMILLFIAGFSMLTVIASCNTIIQSTLDERMRGRVMSLYGMSFIGAMPLGNLLSGTLASVSGVGPVLVLFGLSILLLWMIMRLANLSEKLIAAETS